MRQLSRHSGRRPGPGHGESLRVLYSFPHPMGGPGIGTTAWHQVSGLARAGHRVDVVTTSVARPLPDVARVVTTMSGAGVRVPHRALGAQRALAYHDARTAAMLRRSAGRYDVVHTWPSAALHTLRVAQATGVAGLREVPNTHSAHAYDVVEAELQRLGMTLPAGHSHRRNAARLVVEEAEYAAADGLLVPSEHAAATFLERGFVDGRLLRHRYGFDPHSMGVEPGDGPWPDAVRARRRPAGAPFTAVFLGRCEPRKGLHHALAAWHASGATQSGRFVVCGTFVPGYREALSALLDSPSVELAGFTADPTAAYLAADVLLLPSVEEGSALVTYEAQGLGCVPLVSDAAGARCAHGIQGLVHPAGDVERLTEHLRAVREDPALLDRLSDGALAHAAELTWSAAAEVLAGCYRQALERTGVPR